MMLQYLTIATMHGAMVRVSERARDEVQTATQALYIPLVNPLSLFAPPL